MTPLEKTLRWIVLGGVFLLPCICLYVSYSLYFPFITGKNFTFRIVTEIIAGSWLALALVFPKYRPKRSWILAALALFVLLIAISDAQGVNPFKSFWSNFERMDGWITLAHLLLYVVVAASVLTEEKLWTRLWQTNVGVSVLVSLWGLLQVVGVTAIGQGTAGGLEARVDATFGNPIYLAVYQLFNIFLAAHLWARAWHETPPGKRTGISALYGTVIVLDTIVLFFTGTRGTILGLVGGALLTVLILAWFEGSRRMRRAALGSVVAVVILAGGLWLVRDSSFVKSVGFLDRLATISADNTTINSRLLNMGIAWQGVKERPIFGWGQENYAIVFDKYYDPRMYAQEPWFDRVHNIVFDWLIAGGFIGLISYLSIFGTLLYALWRKDTFTVYERAIFTGLLAGYFVHNLTVFDNITSYILFGSLLAYIAWRSRSRILFEHTKVLGERALPVVAVCAALVVWGGAWYANAGALAQNRAIIQAISNHNDLSINLAAFKEAVGYNALGEQEAREQLTQAAGQLGSSAVDPTMKQQFLELSVSEMQKQEEVSPLDARFPLFLGILYDVYGDYTSGFSSLSKAHDLSPRKQAILFELGANALARKDNAAALSYYKQAFELDENNNQARSLYAAGAIETGNSTLGDQLLAPIIAAGQLPDDRVVSVYVSKGQFSKIVSIWSDHIKAHPDDIQAYFTLAAAYYQMGDKASSIRELQAAETIAPQVKAQVDSLIEQIQKGTLQQ